MKTFKLIVPAILALLQFSLNAQQTAEALSAVEEISFEYFYEHLTYLASDEMRGRNTGSVEYNQAAKYVAKAYEENGLKPFTTGGSFFQAVPFEETSLELNTFNFKVNNKENAISGIWGENISVYIDARNKEYHKKQELVFVGYGNISEKDDINDYKDLDVKGKAVVVVMGGPKGVENRSFNRTYTKVGNAQKQGAAGIIIFSEEGLFKSKMFEGMYSYFSQPRLAISDPDMQRSWVQLDMMAYAKEDLIKEIFKLDNLRLSKELAAIKKGEFASKELSSVIDCSYRVKKEKKDSPNVVAMLPGSDPVLKNEYVVVGAHLDHIGVGKAVKGDSIYNGMWDNATGVAATISMAKAFNDNSIKTKRTILFVAYTGEEKGLYGSRYFTRKFDMQGGKIVANINIDMLGGINDSKDFIPMGYSHSTLSEAADFAASKLQLKVTDDKKLERMYISRSDQIMYITSGIPVLYIVGGIIPVEEGLDIEKEVEEWMEEKYHSPFDDLEQEYSQEAFLDAIKVNFLTTYYIASLLEEIEWNSDSWLYKKYVLKE